LPESLEEGEIGDVDKRGREVSEGRWWARCSLKAALIAPDCCGRLSNILPKSFDLARLGGVWLCFHSNLGTFRRTGHAILVPGETRAVGRVDTPFAEMFG
jgi:hypothetical protein